MSTDELDMDAQVYPTHTERERSALNALRAAARIARGDS